MPQDDLKSRIAAQAKTSGDLRKRMTIAGMEKMPVAPMGVSKKQMSKKWAPMIVRGVANALPVAGGFLGGAAAAPETLGLGTMVGAGAGAVAGREGQKLIEENVFADKNETKATPKEALKDAAITFGVSALSEIPGVVASKYGSAVIKRLATAKDPSEVGDVMKALRANSPFKLTQDGLKGSIEAGNRKLGQQLGQVFSQHAGATADLDSILAPSEQFAEAADKNIGTQMGKANYRAVQNKLRQVIGIAKTKVGIPASAPGAGRAGTALATRGARSATRGTQVSPQQLWDFQQELNNIIRRERVTNPTVAGAVEDILKQTYQDLRGAIVQQAPESASILDRMTDNHAAIDALESYKMGHGGAAAVSLRLRPKTTAGLSPVAAVAAPFAWEAAKDVAGGIAKTVLP